MAQDATLSLLSETEFEFKASSNFPVGSPTLNLCVIWDASDKNLFIYRPQGQVVSKIHQTGKPGSMAPDALTVTWKPDGQFLAVGWSDGVVRLMGLENNKTVHHMDVCEGDARISHIGWAEIVIGKRKKASEVPESLKSVIQGTSMPLDLPEELTFLEIETALPKISPLPTASAGSGDDAVVFTSRTGIEFLFQSPKRSNYDHVNAMIVGTTDGKLHLSVYDAFEIGIFPCPEVDGGTSQLVYHASHPRMSTQALLLSGAAANSVNFVPVDLPFTSSSPINLSLLTSKLTTLQTLLRYLKQTQLHMQVEWKNARELPSRFLRSVQGDLEENEQGPRSIVSALYHTVMTGHAHKPVHEWLIDIIGERNHKRWDKAVVSGLENLRSLVHENFLPSLDRCTIILSRLRGFSQFYSSRDDIGFTSIQISRVLDIISCLSLVGHKILIHVMDELEHFNAFSTWLRFQIDRLATSFSEELTEKEATMDTPKVLGYVEKYLTSSPLDGFFDEVTSEDYAADWQHIEEGPSLLHVLERQLQRRDEGQPSMKALPHVDFLVNYATTWSSRIFKDIAEAKKRSVRFGKPARMDVGGAVSLMDMKMEEGVVVVVLACKELRGKVYIFKTDLNVVNGISTSKQLHSCCVDVDRAIVDIKLLDTKTLMVLCTAPGNTSEVLSIPTEGNLAFTPHKSADDISTVNFADVTSTLKYVLPSENAMRPSRMEVHQRRDERGEIPNRISLLSANRSIWRTFSIPAQ